MYIKINKQMRPMNWFLDRNINESTPESNAKDIKYAQFFFGIREIRSIHENNSILYLDPQQLMNYKTEKTIKTSFWK